MLAWSLVRTVGLGVVAAALALGCVVQSEPQGGYGGGSGDTGPSTGTGSSSGGSGTPLVAAHAGRRRSRTRP